MKNISFGVSEIGLDEEQKNEKEIEIKNDKKQNI